LVGFDVIGQQFRGDINHPVARHPNLAVSFTLCPTPGANFLLVPSAYPLFVLGTPDPEKFRRTGRYALRTRAGRAEGTPVVPHAPVDNFFQAQPSDLAAQVSLH
jgi:hypothetical protein